MWADLESALAPVRRVSRFCLVCKGLMHVSASDWETGGEQIGEGMLLLALLLRGFLSFLSFSARRSEQETSQA